ncbi:MAG: hypothetical protein WDN26_00815 [Chitinophagaceae bacterium]
MDAGPKEKNSAKSPEVENIFLLLKLVSTEETVKKFEEDYTNATIRYGDLKQQLGDDMVKFISPIREKVNAILAEEKILKGT